MTVEGAMAAESKLFSLLLRRAFVIGARGTFVTGEGAIAAESDLPLLPLMLAFVAGAGVAIMETDFTEVDGKGGCYHWGVDADMMSAARIANCA